MSLKGKLRTNENLAEHTSFKVGGTVQYWVEPRDLSDLQILVNLACKKKIPLRIIGAGTNILVDDRKIKGIVVKLSSPCFKKIAVRHPANLEYQRRGGQRVGVRSSSLHQYIDVGVNQQIISVGAGASLVGLLKYAQKSGFSGCELLAGIPGTVGGALIMNAGNIGDRVSDVTVMDRQGRVKILNRKDIHFSYRDSNLNRYIILSAHFRLTENDKRVIKKRINDYLDYRKKTQDLSWSSAGCVFKNPLPLPSNSYDDGRLRRIVHRSPAIASSVGGEGGQGLKSVLRLRSGLTVSVVKPSAAYFIECCGLKGSSFGDATVSFKHANFIINRGKASFVDISRLMAYINRCVKKRFNLDLKPEIKIWRS